MLDPLKRDEYGIYENGKRTNSGHKKNSHVIWLYFHFQINVQASFNYFVVLLLFFVMFSSFPFGSSLVFIAILFLSYRMKLVLCVCMFSWSMCVIGDNVAAENVNCQKSDALFNQNKRKRTFFLDLCVRVCVGMCSSACVYNKQFTISHIQCEYNIECVHFNSGDFILFVVFLFLTNLHFNQFTAP